MLKKNRFTNFFWFYYILIFIAAIYDIFSISFSFDLKWDGAVGILLIILSIFAIIDFKKKKLKKITLIIPISHLSYHAIWLTIGTVHFILIANGLTSNPQLLSKLSDIFDIFFNAFKIIFIIYLYKLIQR